jgi:hypothetical protein
MFLRADVYKLKPREGKPKGDRSLQITTINVMRVAECLNLVETISDRLKDISVQSVGPILANGQQIMQLQDFTGKDYPRKTVIVSGGQGWPIQFKLSIFQWKMYCWMKELRTLGWLSESSSGWLQKAWVWLVDGIEGGKATGLVVSHLTSNKADINPLNMIIETNDENVKREKRCKWGRCDCWCSPVEDGVMCLKVCVESCERCLRESSRYKLVRKYVRYNTRQR